MAVAAAAVTAVTVVTPVTSVTSVTAVTGAASAVMRPRSRLRSDRRDRRRDRRDCGFDCSDCGCDRRDDCWTAVRTFGLEAANAAALGSPTDAKCPMALSHPGRCRAYVAAQRWRQDRALETAWRMVNKVSNLLHRAPPPELDSMASA